MTRIETQAVPDNTAAVHGPLALVQFDSHADTWVAYFGKKYNHGTVFRRAVEEGLLDPSRSIQVGMRGPLCEAGDLGASRELGFELITTDGIREIGVRETAERVRGRVGAAKTYVSFDVDFVDPANARGDGTYLSVDFDALIPAALRGGRRLLLPARSSQISRRLRRARR